MRENIYIYIYEKNILLAFKSYKKKMILGSKKKICDNFFTFIKICE